jgi:hypothetical protein
LLLRHTICLSSTTAFKTKKIIITILRYLMQSWKDLVKALIIILVSS